MNSIPSSWITTTLGEVIYSKVETVTPEEIPDNAWVLELEDIERDNSKLLQRVTFAARPSKSNKNIFFKGDVLYGKLRPYLNKVIIADEDGYCSTEIIPLKPNNAITSKFLFYWLKHPVFLGYVESVIHGLNMPRLGTQSRNNAPIFIAPVEEQKRISDKLDKLFSRVEICQNKIINLPSVISRFEQATLDAAVTGYLTVEWRTKKGTTSEWPIAKLGDITLKVGSGSTPRGGESVYIETGTPLIRSTNVLFSSIRRDDLVYMDEAQANDMLNAEVKTGDVLLNITGASIGRAAVLPSDLNGARVNQHVCIIRPNKEVISEFLCLSLLSSRIQKGILEENYGATRQALTKNQILDFTIYLPSINEQKEVIRRVSSMIGYIQRIDDEYDNISSRVKQLTPALLRKAFSGELVPQNLDDEPIAKALERSKIDKEYAAKRRILKPKIKKERRVSTSLELVLAEANDWIKADEAFKLCGAKDGADSEHIERLYAELRSLDKSGKLEVRPVEDEHGRKQYDLIRLLIK